MGAYYKDNNGITHKIAFYEKGDNLPSPKEEETKTVTPDFASGNVVVTPTSGKVLSQVTINKDANFIADNLKKDVTVFGITGTLESGGVDLSRVMPIVFQLYVSKPTGSMTLNYNISSSMLDKRFFFDINGNSYLPSQVSVYFSGTLKGTANQNIVLYSSSVSHSGSSVSFKVGALEVGIPPYYYVEYNVIAWTTGSIRIVWSAYGTTVTPVTESMRFIQAPNDLFNNFPEYAVLDYWNADNMFAAMSPTRPSSSEFKVGWDVQYID